MPLSPTLWNDVVVVQAAFARIVGALQPSDLERATVNDKWTVRDVINHVVDGDHWLVRNIETGEDVFSDTDFVGNEPASLAVTRSNAALSSALEEILAHPESNHGMPIEDMIAIRIEEMLGHGWDIAEATGQDRDIAPEAAGRCLERVRTKLGDAGSRGEFYKPEHGVSPDASMADQLAAFAGKPVPATR